MSSHSSHAKKFPVKLRYVVGGLVLIALVTIAIVDLQPFFAYQAKKNKIRELIPIGSNIDDAGPILKSNGFRYYDKHFATVDEDYYWMEVIVAHKPRPKSLSLMRLSGIRLYFHYVVIEANLDNEVRRIY